MDAEAGTARMAKPERSQQCQTETAHDGAEGLLAHIERRRIAMALGNAISGG